MRENNKKILLVEDDPFILKMYTEKLRAADFEVDCVEDGASALKIAKEKNPDLILLDVVIPLIDGFETLKTIKKEERLKEVPVVLLTNLGQKKDVEKGLALGAEDYIIKAHFTPSEVIEKVKKIIKSNN